MNEFVTMSESRTVTAHEIFNTNTIYYGTQDTEKHMWIGQKTDVTDDVIAAVYEWFMGNMEDSEGEKEEYQITYPSTEFELVMRRKKTENI